MMNIILKKGLLIKLTGLGLGAGIFLLGGCSKEAGNLNAKVENKPSSTIMAETPKPTSTMDANESVKPTELKTANPIKETIPTAGNNKSIKNADTKKAALEILKSKVKIDTEEEFTDAGFKDGKSGYTWDDGSFYAFTVKNKNSGDMGDIGSLFLVKKNTMDVYKLDLEKDLSGNKIKKYQP